MADYLGDFAEDATVRGSFNTRDAAGAPITLAGSPTLAVYKDAGVSESTAGVTLTVDFDSRTGHHVFVVDTSADAFYATGSDYRVVLTAGTVDGTSVVGVEVGRFSVQNRYMRGTNSAALATDWTSQRANYVDKLNVTGTLAHSDDAATYRADLTSTQGAILDAIAAVDLIVDAIKLKTDNLPSDPATETTLAVIDGLIDAIKAKTDQLAFTVANQVDANALSGGGGGGLDAAGVRAAIGLASANLDTQLADIPTVAEFNARTLPSADYFVVGDYTAPDNTSIAAILVDTNELQTNQNNWLTADVSGLSTLTAQQVWEYVTRTLTSAGSGGATAQEVWEYATRTLTATSDSAGVTTLLSRVPGTIRTATEDVTAETAQTAAIRDGLALESTSQTILADTNELQSRFATMLEDDGASGWQFTVLALENGPAGSGGGGSVVVVPASATVIPRAGGTYILAYTAETGTVSITVLDSSGSPVSLAGKSLGVYFETMQRIDVASVTSGITISGSGNNVASFAMPSAVTEINRSLRFALRDRAAPKTVYAGGIFDVEYLPEPT